MFYVHLLVINGGTLQGLQQYSVFLFMLLSRILSQLTKSFKIIKELLSNVILLFNCSLSQSIMKSLKSFQQTVGTSMTA